ELEIAIDEVEIKTDCSLQRLETVIHLVLKCLSELKEYVLKSGFNNTNEEIRFFKYQKPVIVAKLIYYNAIYKIETKKPYGTKPIRKYLNKVHNPEDVHPKSGRYIGLNDVGYYGHSG